MERQSPDVSEPRAPDKPDEDSQADDNSQSRATDKPDDDSQPDDDRELRENTLHLTSEHAHGFRLISEPDEDSQADDNSQSRAPDKPDDDSQPDDDREPDDDSRDEFERLLEPDDDREPDDHRRSRSSWSRMYSVITHSLRVVGHLLCLSWTCTSEPVPPKKDDFEDDFEDEFEPVPPKKDEFARPFNLTEMREMRGGSLHRGTPRIIEEIKKEKPVAILYPVPPAPPPPNPPI